MSEGASNTEGSAATHPASERFRVVLLGPQRFHPTVRPTLDSLAVGPDEPLALITAGWQEREGEDGELRDHLGCPAHNLDLYRRAEELLYQDPELAEALADRQHQLRELQRLYRMRLDHALEPARELLELEKRDRFAERHLRAAMRIVRTVDRQHLTDVRGVHEAFAERWQLERRDRIVRHRQQLTGQLDGVAAVAVAGGHVAVLLNRMRLFGLDSLLAGRRVIAWSAGAMALAERVVLFHDSPPQGAGNPEILDAGLGLFRNVVPLPHAGHRLRLDDPARVALFARRFSPAQSVLLDDEARTDWDGQGWHPAPGTRVLGRRGAVRELVSG